MTIRFINDWNGFSAGMTRSLSPALEAQAKAERAAVDAVEAAPAPVAVRGDPLTGALIGPDAKPLPAVSGAGNIGRLLRLVIWSDSTGDMTALAANISAMVNNGDGTFNVTSASAGLVPGAVARIVGAGGVMGSASMNLRRAVVLAANRATNVYTFAFGGDTSPIQGFATPFLMVPNQGSSTGWVNHANAALGGALKIVANVSAWGARMEQVTPMIYNEMVGVKADFVVWSQGLNDIYQDTPLAKMQADARTQFDYCDKLGLRMLIVTPPPGDSTLLGATWTLARAQRQRDFCAWLLDEARERGYLAVDSYRAQEGGVACCGFVSPNYNASAGFVATDGLHPNNRSARAIGLAAAAVLAPFAPVKNTVQYRTGNLVVNPQFTGAAGTSSGAGTIVGGSVIPTNWSVSVDAGISVTVSTPARTLAADGDTDGNNLRLVITSTSAGFINIGGAGAFSGLAAGDTLNSDLTAVVAANPVGLQSISHAVRCYYKDPGNTNYIYLLQTLAGASVNRGAGGTESLGRLGDVLPPGWSGGVSAFVGIDPRTTIIVGAGANIDVTFKAPSAWKSA